MCYLGWDQSANGKLILKLVEQLSPLAVKNEDALKPGARRFTDEHRDFDTTTPFQHDRDQIIHSRAFRRLRGKTQVLLATVNDNYRKRLSHTLQVAHKVSRPGILF